MTSGGVSTGGTAPPGPGAGAGEALFPTTAGPGHATGAAGGPVSAGTGATGPGGAGTAGGGASTAGHAPAGATPWLGAAGLAAAGVLERDAELRSQGITEAQFLGVDRGGLKRYRWEPDGAEMVLVPPGEFLMGSRGAEGDGDERPPHRVRIGRAFLMDCTEVTWERYRAFAAATGQALPDSPVEGSYGDYPVRGVSWDDAMAFARWVGKRLPSEAEWEYACRAGTSGPVPWGEADPRAHAWCSANSSGVPHPAARLAPNAWGFFDLLGNVHEWCQDAYEVDYYARAPRSDPLNEGRASSPRVLRGGSWATEPGRELRSAHRGYADPSRRITGSFGFRCAR
ncbi:MAG: SUMF1/EgtB/PvdO family nonheme iron enzyme [Planctomycetes bacterium]|nr:SUMF1/EgtB/PvdO family nonheme iron enzyme [Planctomycetota bacterium]